MSSGRDKNQQFKKDILKIINDNPGITNKEISQVLGLSVRKVCNQNIRLTKMGVIRQETHGRNTKLFIAKNGFNSEMAKGGCMSGEGLKGLIEAEADLVEVTNLLREVEEINSLVILRVVLDRVLTSMESALQQIRASSNSLLMEHQGLLDKIDGLTKKETEETEEKIEDLADEPEYRVRELPPESFSIHDLQTQERCKRNL